MPHYFGFTEFVKNYLVYGWNTTTFGGLCGLIVLTLGMAWIFELIRALTQEVLCAIHNAGLVRAEKKAGADAISTIGDGELMINFPLISSSNKFQSQPPESCEPSYIAEQTADSRRPNTIWCRLWMHSISTIMHICSYGSASLLMLAVMCFNIWILIGCCVGHAMGILTVTIVQRNRLNNRAQQYLKRGGRGTAWQTCTSHAVL